MLFRKNQKHYFLSDKTKGTICLYLKDQQNTLGNIANTANKKAVQQMLLFIYLLDFMFSELIRSYNDCWLNC